MPAATDILILPGSVPMAARQSLTQIRYQGITEGQGVVCPVFLSSVPLPEVGENSVAEKAWTGAVCLLGGDQKAGVPGLS
jgi:hypothetical protein